MSQEPKPFDWATPLTLLKEAYELLQGVPPVGMDNNGNYVRYRSHFHSYIDVNSSMEALEQIIDGVQWQVDHPDAVD